MASFLKHISNTSKFPSSFLVHTFSWVIMGESCIYVGPWFPHLKLGNSLAQKISKGVSNSYKVESLEGLIKHVMGGPMDRVSDSVSKNV